MPDDPPTTVSEFKDRHYDQTLVSYIDVLGFGALLRERQPSEVARVLSTLKRTLAVGGRVHRGRSDEIIKIFKPFNFSDLIVRTTRIEPGANVAEILDWEFYYLSENQLALALEGILIRGAVCIDFLLADTEHSMVFGPALAKSYALESQYAVYPRIVVDRDLIWQAQDSGYMAHLQDYCSRGEDGAYFVDYLFATSLTGLELGVPGEEPDARQRIQSHRDMIVKAIENGISSSRGEAAERIKQKWIWLALYHNASVRRLKERLRASPRGTGLEHFTIPEDLLRF